MTSKGILFFPHERTCPVDREDSVLEVALKNQIDIGHSCGGMGSCTTCRVVIEKGLERLPERNELEQDIADMRDFAANERLSCQIPPLDGLVVRVPDFTDSDT